jgi:hypothetical protein
MITLHHHAVSRRPEITNMTTNKYEARVRVGEMQEARKTPEAGRVDE